MWHWLLALLASWSADPSALDREAPLASAAVSVAYAASAVEAAPPTPPAPAPPAPKPSVCSGCAGKGYIVHGDGHRTVCPTCKGKSCATCAASASPTTVLPLRPAGGG